MCTVFYEVCVCVCLHARVCVCVCELLDFALLMLLLYVDNPFSTKIKPGFANIPVIHRMYAFFESLSKYIAVHRFGKCI